jgi:uncharacterized protein (TIGR02271 family)
MARGKKITEPISFNSNEIKAESEKIQVLEEKVEVSKRIVEKAKIRLSKKVNQKTESYDIPLGSEEIVVKRVPKNEMVDKAPPGVRYEGNVMIIPVLKEVAVIEKRLMLVEEIHVTKHKSETTETRQVVVRKEEIQVERTEIITPPQ